MFDGFAAESVESDGLDVFVRHAGSGPPVLLLHGHPRTSATWHRVAPALVDAGYAVVCADLPGYGRSGKPERTADHSAYSKRASADRLRSTMAELGHDRFDVVGHDRGSYVAYRMALDHPDVVTRVALLDGIPIGEHLRRTDARFATAWWHWFFYAQAELPERIILADPDAWYRGSPETMGADNHAEWRAAMRDPDVVRGMLEDYRAGLTVDFADDEADRARGARITCPLLVLWSLRDDLEELYGDPRVIWRDWADDVRGAAIDSGHHMAEEAPEEVASALVRFLADAASDNRASHGDVG